MKAFVCLLGLLLVVVSGSAGHHMPEEFKEVFKACHAELGMPDEKPKGPPDENDPKVKCFHACLMKKSGTMADGKIDAEKQVEMFKKHMKNSEEGKIETIEECVKEANEQSEECEVAGAFHKCLRDKFGPPPPPPSD